MPRVHSPRTSRARNRSVARLLAVAVLTSMVGVSAVNAAPPDTATPLSNCVVPAEPNDTPGDAQVLPATASCVTAANDDGGQDFFKWTVGEADAGQRWTLAATGIPGQLVTVQVHRVELDEGGEVLESELLASAEGAVGEGASISNVLVPAGEYFVAVGSSGPGPYDLSIAPGDAAPAANDIEPNDDATVATAVGPGIALSGDRAGTDDWFAWTLADADAAQLWTLSLRVPLLSEANLFVTSEDGTELFEGSAGTDGVLRVADLGLAPGRYLIQVTAGDDAVAPYILEATPGAPRAEGQEVEPNDTFANAFPITASATDATVVHGRLATVPSDVDVYRLSIDDTTAGRLTDVKLFWQGEQTRSMCLQDSAGNELQCGNDAESVTFDDLVLQQGEYGIVVEGAGPPDDTYLLRVDVTGEATSGFEAEPNDTVDLASPLDVSGDHPTGSGRFDAQGDTTDTDVFRFTVTGEPQLWEITVEGPGVTSAETVDAAGYASVADETTDGTATLYDVFLVPGDHAIRVIGTSDVYTVAARPLGPPDPQAEHEPNDTVDHSQPIRLAETRTGRLVQDTDLDLYRFSLQNDGHVLINVESPPDLQIQLALDAGSVPVGRVAAPEPGDDIAYDAVLPAGDYAVTLDTSVPSLEYYGITIEPRDPFVLPDDAEPNDTPDQASPIPDDSTVTGSIDLRSSDGDVDWYVFPAASTERSVTFQVNNDVTYLELVTPETPDDIGTDIDLEDGTQTGSYTAELPADTPVLLGVQGDGDYEIAITQPGTAASDARTTGVIPVDVTISDCAKPVAAYWTESQRLDCRLELANTGDAPLDVTLDAATGHYAWSVDFESADVTLPPGETTTVPVAIHVASDAWADQPIVVTARASGDDGASTGSTTVVPSRDALPLNPEPQEALPPELLGGLDVAWSGLGASPVSIDEFEAEEEGALYDQLTPVGYGWTEDTGSLPAELTVDLAGEELVPVAGITLNPQGGSGAVGEQLRSFDLELSVDGETFTPALSGELSALPVEQSFTLPAPVDARFARLRVNSNQNADESVVLIGEWAVIATPGWTLPAESAAAGLDLAAPERGGHVLDMRPADSSYDQWNDLVTVNDALHTVTVEPGELVSWIIGFHHDRTAQLSALSWVDTTVSDAATRFNEVQVEVSVDGPAGPWVAAGTWTLDRSAGAPPPFTFAAPTWARFVRITGTPAAPAQGESFNWEVPDAIHVYEYPADATYRSILGEWGQYSQAAIYEQLLPPTPITLNADAGNDADNATLLPLGTTVNDTAWIGKDEDWYRVQVPDGQSALAFTLSSTPTVDVDVALFDSSGTAVAVTASESSTARETRYTALVTSGAEYLVRITEPPSSVIFAFDTSLSIEAYAPAVYQGLIRYAGDVEPGQDSVNIIPFGGDLLLPEWTDEPYLIQAAVTNYDQSLGSSNAEGAMLTANEALATQDGAQAIMLITDAQTAPDSGGPSSDDEAESTEDEDATSTDDVEDSTEDDGVSILDDDDLSVLDDTTESSLSEEADADPEEEEGDEDASESSVAEEPTESGLSEETTETSEVDAESSAADSGTTPSQIAQLWPSLEGVQPRIYAVHIAGGEPLDQDVMEDWASVNDGIYTYAPDQRGIDIAFDRAATILRRPSYYTLSVAAVAPPPPPTTTTTVPAAPGYLNVLPAPAIEGQPVAVGGVSVGIIFDTSGSMLQQLDDGSGSRIDAARAALTNLVAQTIPAGTNVSLRAFGDSPESCDTRLIVPLSPLDQAAMAGVIQNLPVVDGVKTPIGASLQAVAGDLGTAPGPKIIVLVTDGEETCGGDPGAAIQAMIDSGIDVRVNIVGFALDDQALKDQFQQWAQIGQGQYIDAGNQAELTAAIAAAVQPTYDVLDANGAVIASGQAGGNPLELPAGTYVIDVHSEPVQRFDIEILPGQTLDVPLV